MEQHILTIKALKETKRLGMNNRSDSEILPGYYKYVVEPYYKGDGEHSIKEMQQILNQYKEYAHQQAIIKQRLIEFINQTPSTI